MPKKRPFIVVTAIVFLFCVMALLVYAVCQGSEDFTLTVYRPTGGVESSCTETITPVGGTDCNQQSNPSCIRNVVCGERGTYTAAISFCGHGDGCDATTVDVLTCSYDDCPNCCTSGTSYTWATGGESAPFGGYDTGTSTECCEDDGGEFFQAADVGGLDRCCNNGNDCAINGNCVTAGNNVGDDCCYGVSQVDSVRPTCNVYSSGDTCYYNGNDNCNAGSGWECLYSTKTCDAGGECSDTCGIESCRYGSTGWDYADVSVEPEICGDGYDNNCDGLTDDEDPECCDCSPTDYCCTDGCHFDAPGTICNTTDVCMDGSTLCDFKTCDAAGSCVNFGGCAACVAGTPFNECGEWNGNCLSQAGGDMCDVVSDETLCCNIYGNPDPCCDMGCNSTLQCYYLSTAQDCVYVYSECMNIANNPESGEEPSNPAQCALICHNFWNACP